MTDTTNTEAAAVAELARKAAQPFPILGEIREDVALVVLDGGAEGPDQAEILDLEEYLPEPVRVRGLVTVDDSVSLVAYVSRFEQEDRGALYADIDSCTIKAVLNGPQNAETPGWGDHVAILALRKSIEWNRWAHKDRTYMSQADFAELIEEGIDDIVEPSGADMLELSTTFEAHTTAAFKQGTSLSDGARQLTYEETVDATAGRSGQVVIPKTITLRLRPFEGGEALAITARLRFRLRDGRLTLAFFMDEPTERVRDAFRTVVNDVIEATQVNAYYGRRSA
jgi:uncharacterized protein YfdQ (DUF2303 family)